MKTCVISQPRFFPGLNYLHRMLMADVFVILDNVRFNPRHEENRARLPAGKGTKWLTVPTPKEDRRSLIKDVRISQDIPWQASARGVLLALYQGTQWFNYHSEEIMEIIDTGFDHVVDLATTSWQPAIRHLEIGCTFILASELEAGGRGTTQLVNICQEIEATHYLSGGFGRDYLDPDEFADAGITLGIHQFKPQPYQQISDGWTPWLSYLDVLFNVGLDRKFIAAQGRAEWDKTPGERMNS